jgi:hypothetical protein
MMWCMWCSFHTAFFLVENFSSNKTESQYYQATSTVTIIVFIGVVLICEVIMTTKITQSCSVQMLKGVENHQTCKLLKFRWYVNCNIWNTRIAHLDMGPTEILFSIPTFENSQDHSNYKSSHGNLTPEIPWSGYNMCHWSVHHADISSCMFHSSTNFKFIYDGGLAI